MKITVGQAAKETGKSKSTISRAIKSGRLSAAKDGTGFLIDPSELFRVYGAPVAQPMTQPRAQPPETQATEIAVLRAQLEARTEVEALLRDTVEDLRQRLTRAELLLTDQRAKPDAAQADPGPTSPSLWRRLFGQK